MRPTYTWGKKGPLSTAICGVSELEKRSIKPVTWFDTPQTLKEFLWYETAEGKKYAQAIDRAQREGKVICGVWRCAGGFSKSRGETGRGRGTL